MPGGFFEALEVLFSLNGVLLLIAGTVAGAISGLIPGLSGLTGMALFLPLTLAMSPGGALLFFAGVAGAPRFTGAILGIVLNIPGTPTSAATTYDGYPMARRGEADRAISIAATASIIGTIFGVLVLLALMPVVLLALKVVGPAELFGLAVLALTTIAYASSTEVGAFVKGLASGGIGLMLGFIGVATVTGLPRFSFGSDLYLYEGVRLIPLFIGMFAVAQIIRFAVDDRGAVSQVERGEVRGGGVRRGIKDTFRHWSTNLQGSAIGAAVGLMPGVGGVAANFLSYSWAKGRSKHPEEFGKGAPEGIVASESSDNAEMIAHIVPTISFGIPGSAEGALILGLLTLQGYLVGPLLLTRAPETLWLLVVGSLLSALVVSILGMLLVRQLANITLVPMAYLVPSVLIASLFGTYSAHANLLDVAMAVLVGIVGYFFIRSGYSPASLVIGYVLAPLVEDQFVLGFQSGGRSYATFFNTPSAIVIWALVGVIILMSIRSAQRTRTDPGSIEADGPASEGRGIPSIILGVLSAAFIGYLLLESVGLQALARRVPLIIGVPTLVILVGVVAAELIALVRSRRGATETQTAGADARLGSAAEPDGQARLVRLALVIGWLLLYVALLYLLGFVIASVVVAVVYTVVELGPERPDLSMKQSVLRVIVVAVAVGLILIGAVAGGMSTFDGVLFGDVAPRY